MLEISLGGVDELVEFVGVDLIDAWPELVSGWDGGDHLCAEGSSQRRHVSLEGLVGAGRWIVAPDSVDQLGRGDDARVVQRQRRHDSTMLLNRDVDRGAGGDDRDRPQQAYPYRESLRLRSHRSRTSYRCRVFGDEISVS